MADVLTRAMTVLDVAGCLNVAQRGELLGFKVAVQAVEGGKA